MDHVTNCSEFWFVFYKEILYKKTLYNAPVVKSDKVCLLGQAFVSEMEKWVDLRHKWSVFGSFSEFWMWNLMLCQTESWLWELCKEKMSYQL